MTASSTLPRRTLGSGTLMILAIVASSPLTVLVGGIPTTYAATGVAGVPLSFLIIMPVLALASAGYLVTSRYMTSAAPFFALLARGLGATAGLGAAVVGFIGYNAIQISLYGFLGSRLAQLAGGQWWHWAGGAWLVVAVSGLIRLTVNTIWLGALMLIELMMIGLFVLAAITHPAPAMADPGVWSWHSLAGPGLGGVLALGMAAFVGSECAPVYAEESRSPRTVVLSTFAVIAILGLLYTAGAWAVVHGIGLSALTSGQDPAQQVLDVLQANFGAGVVDLTSLLLVSSVLAALSSFHHVVARNLYALARERVLPASLEKLSGRGTPVAGSMVQSAVAACVLVIAALTGADPMGVVFAWLSTIGALFVLTLLVISSVAAYAFFRSGGGTSEHLLIRAVIPIGGALCGGLVLLFMVSNLDSLLGLAPGSRWAWLPVVLLAACAAAGCAWGLMLRWRRPALLRGLGSGAPAPVGVLDQRLREVQV